MNSLAAEQSFNPFSHPAIAFAERLEFQVIQEIHQEIAMNPSVLRNRRASLSLLAGAAMVLSCGAAWANEWPTKPIKVFVPYAAGGPVDM